jgi:hypothetical protein
MPPLPTKLRLPPEYQITQDEFVAHYWAPEPGQHVSLIGPNGVGKTTIGLKLLAQCTQLHPQTIGIALAMKPHRGPKSEGRKATGDATVARLTRALGGRVTRTWRPPWWQQIGREPAFWTLWPKHSDEFRADLARHRELFERAILDSYNTGNRWIFADEIFSLVAELKLDPELIHVWSKGRSMKCAIIGATQRPAMVPRWMYSSAIHLFLWRDNDADARKRYGEISGIDPKRLTALTDGLRKHECLYVCPSADIMACITPSAFIPDPRTSPDVRTPEPAAAATHQP